MDDRSAPVVSPGTSSRLLRLREVSHRVGLARSTIYRWMDEERFPRPVQLGARTVVWPEHVIDAWIARQVATGSSHGGAG